MRRLPVLHPYILPTGCIHTGCGELFVNDSVRTLKDLKGKTVAAPEHSSRQAFVAGLATFVGLDPLKDITWINHEPGPQQYHRAGN